MKTRGWIGALTGASLVAAAGLIGATSLTSANAADPTTPAADPTTPAAIRALKEAGIRVVMLTGDNKWYQALIGLAVLLQFNRFAIATGIASLLIVAIYPFMKRITWWPQVVLGLAFSWGALMGWAAVFGRLDLPAVLLYAGSIAWVIHYDTIYAHQDAEDDALVGLKSTLSAHLRGLRVTACDPERTSAATPGDGTAVHLSAPGAVRHDVAHQVAHVVLQIPDDVLDDVSDRDHAHDLARVQHW